MWLVDAVWFFIAVDILWTSSFLPDWFGVD